MNCETAREQLGAYADGELSAEQSAEVERHTRICPACTDELRELHEVIGQLAGASRPQPPPQLWSLIEQRLEKASSRPETHTLWARRPLMAAASIAILVGAGVLTGVWLRSGAQVAKADEVNFALLLDGLATDVDSSFARFLQYHQAEPIAAQTARAAAPGLRFDVPQTLPEGFRLQQVYRFPLGTQVGIAACYKRGSEPLIVFFHRPTNKEHFGIRTEMSCQVEGRELHTVEVGAWRLVHYTDPTTCHCVLSRLDLEKELPAVFTAIAPGFQAGNTAGAH
jgi:hypothetical protein